MAPKRKSGCQRPEALSKGEGTSTDAMPPAAASATVNDLKILDNNAQTEQQLNQLLDDSSAGTDDGAAVPTT